MLDYTYILTDGAIEYVLGDREQAVKDTIVRLAVETIFDEVKFKDLGNRTISDWVKNQTGQYIFPLLSDKISSR